MPAQQDSLAQRAPCHPAGDSKESPIEEKRRNKGIPPCGTFSNSIARIQHNARMLSN